MDFATSLLRAGRVRRECDWPQAAPPGACASARGSTLALNPVCPHCPLSRAGWRIGALRAGGSPPS
eukprot:10188248-Alexandrium_andersonii.AAC.1